MEILRIPKIMQDSSQTAYKRGRSVGFVPTMGALHEGHMSLVRACRQENDMTVVSIFVNPTQFGPAEDFKSYPRDIDADTGMLRDAGVDIVFMPAAGAVYPEGFRTKVEVEGLSDKLCGAYRPGHFQGVATVVAKLLNMVSPVRAYFGLKDYQQSLIIKRLVKDLDMPVEIVGCPTKREPDGLAMSSRNAYLSAGQREAAKVLYRALSAAASEISRDGARASEVKKGIMKTLSSEPLVTRIDYAGLYDPDTLDEIKEHQGTKGRLLIAGAVWLENTRLIDNMLL